MNKPEYIGPGYWSSWHTRSITYKTIEDQTVIKKSIIQDIETYPCGKCKTHAQNFLYRNPIPVDGKMALFEWTVKFHNSVNLLLDKKFIELDEAVKMWSEEGVCTEDCGDEEIVIDPDDRKTFNNFTIY